MSGMYPSYSDTSAPFLLDPLRTSAIDSDPAEDHAAGQPRPSEDFVMAGNGPENWAVHGSNTESQLPHEYGFQMSDWISSGPSGLSASGTLMTSTQGTAVGADEFSTSAKSEGMARPGQTLEGGLGKGGEGSLEWMSSEGGINALSPVSLEGLVSSVEKAAGADTEAPNGPRRNHELDFFSF
jgi:hypothetical protein